MFSALTFNLKRFLSNAGPVQMTVEKKLMEKFSPKHLTVECESDLHHGSAPGSERHFYISIVSDDFEGLKTVEIHRCIYQCLSNELSAGIHALRLDAYPTSKYEDRSVSPPPPCAKD